MINELEYPVYKFKYKHFRGERSVTKALGKLITHLFNQEELGKINVKKVSKEVINKIQSIANQRLLDIYETMGEVIEILLPAGLRMDPADKRLDDLDGELCLDYLYAILEKNSGFFMRLLLSPVDITKSLSSIVSPSTTSK